MQAELAQGDDKPCIWCGETIKAAARICRYCNREQTEPQQEEVLYEGIGNMPISDLVLSGFAVLIVIGLFFLPYYYVRWKKRVYRVTTKRVEVRYGILSKKVDTLELYRVNDIQFQSQFGFGKIILISSDATTPTFELPLPGAEQLFRRLQEAIPEARRQMGIQLKEHA